MSISVSTLFLLISYFILILKTSICNAAQKLVPKLFIGDRLMLAVSFYEWVSAMSIPRVSFPLELLSRCLIGGMTGKGKIVIVGKIGKKGKIGCH